VLKTLPSSSRISRRITLSRVVVLPVKFIRLTKYCDPSSIRMVMPTVGASTLAGPICGGARRASGTSAAS